MTDKRGGWNDNDARQEKREPIAPMADLICKQFVPDSRSVYCLECGYLLRDHKRPAVSES